MLLPGLSEAVQEIAYTSYHNQVTQCQIEPYGIAGWNGHWYVVGYCCLRQELRIFRLERVQSAQFLNKIFELVEHFDRREYILKHLATIPATRSIEHETLLQLAEQLIQIATAGQGG